MPCNMSRHLITHPEKPHIALRYGYNVPYSEYFYAVLDRSVPIGHLENESVQVIEGHLIMSCPPEKLLAKLRDEFGAGAEHPHVEAVAKRLPIPHRSRAA